MQNDLVTIMSFTDSHDAATVRCFLESEAVFTVIQGEFSSRIYPIPGAVKIQVREEDLERAIDLLKSGGYL